MLRAVFIATIFVVSSYAQDVQDFWANPEAPDFTSTLPQGDIFVIEWTSDLALYFGEFCPDCNTTDVELWITEVDNSNSLQIGCKTLID